MTGLKIKIPDSLGEREVTKAINEAQSLRQMLSEVRQQAQEIADQLLGEIPEEIREGAASICPDGDTGHLHYNLNEVREEVERLSSIIARISRV